jgi:hypothetical protein
VTPAVGQLWRVRSSGNVYRVVALRPEAEDCYQRVELELVELGPGLTEFRPNGYRMAVELAWFENGAATLRQPELPGVSP